MSITTLANPTSGAIGPSPFVGPIVSGTNAVQTLTLGGTITGGTFPLGNKQVAWSSTNTPLLANIQAALDAYYGSGVATAAAGTLTSGIGTVTITFGGVQGLKPVTLLVTNANSLTGTSPTAAIATTTPGVAATFRNAIEGQLIVDTSTGILYANTSSTLYSPTWTKVGTQT